MTSIDQNIENGAETLDAWVKPEIVSFEPISATQAATSNLGDALDSNS